jgi:cytochrome c oxidase subunit 3
MALLVASESMLFAVMLTSYFYVRWNTTRELPGGWPPAPHGEEKLLFPSLLLAAILASGVTMLGALRAAQAGRARALGAALLATLGLGGGFLALQVLDYVERHREYTPQADAYASFVWTITGAHAAHVVGGMLLLAWVWGRAVAGAYSRERHLGVRVAAMYWQFLVILEAVIYLCLFVTPYL